MEEHVIMKIAIIGAGGVGGYFGGKLAAAGNDVTFVARGQHLKAIQSGGLTVKSIYGDFRVQPAKAVEDIGSIGKTQLIILGVKAWQVKDVSKKLNVILDDDTVVMPLQNGVSAIEEIAESIEEKNIIGGSCRIISKVEAPGVINHMGIAPTIVFGELNNQTTQRIQRIKDIFDAAAIESFIPRDIQAEIWKKFISICISGLGAITRSTYGEMREVEESRTLIRELLTEIYNVAIAAGVSLKEDLVEKIMDVVDRMPYNSTSSLIRDVMEGRPSEIEYQNGTVVKLGLKFGVPTPVNRFIYNCITPMERRARIKSSMIDFPG
jgi:2-dehydropantoate 2-reductase